MIKFFKRPFCKCPYREITVNLKDFYFGGRYLLQSKCLDCGKIYYSAYMTIKQIQNFFGEIK